MEKEPVTNDVTYVKKIFKYKSNHFALWLLFLYSIISFIKLTFKIQSYVLSLLYNSFLFIIEILILDDKNNNANEHKISIPANIQIPRLDN